MKRLTDKQRAALRSICAMPGKSGKFWSGEHSVQVLKALESLDLAEGKAASIFDTTAARQAWHPTRAGIRRNNEP